MLRFGDVALNRTRFWFDIPCRMSPSHHNTNPSDTAAELAHELANLLDGSLRHLGIAIDTLSQSPPAPEKPLVDEDLLQRLQTTDRSMRQMASLIHAWMRSAPQPRDLFEQTQTLVQTLQQVVEIHQPSAERHGITLRLEVDPVAEKLPAGPVFPVVANALLNSIEAIAGMTGNNTKQAAHQITVSARCEAGQVWLIVTDDGPGLDANMLNEQGALHIGRTTKPNGHGLGLTLGQQIAQSLDGRLTLTNRPEGGAQLILRYPAASLKRPDPAHAPTLTTTPHE